MSYKEYVTLIENALPSFLPNVPNEYQKILEAMKYSLLSGGKRMRGILLLEFCKMFGGSIDDALVFACAIEMIHAYSLIHDDLPCMDDDDERRGKPSCHIAFDEATALLAGDALLNTAFEIMLASNAKYKLEAMQIIAKASGVNGMIGGQIIDLSTINTPMLIELKTIALIKAAAMCAGRLANADAHQMKAAEIYAGNIGFAFQIVDDILDMDKNEGSKNYVNVYGEKKAREIVEEKTNEAIKAISGYDSGFLVSFAKDLANRVV